MADKAPGELTPERYRFYVKELRELAGEIPLPDFVQPLLKPIQTPNWLYVRELGAKFPSVQRCADELKLSRRDVLDSIRGKKGVFHKSLGCCLHIVELKDKDAPLDDRTRTDLIPNVWPGDIDKWVCVPHHDPQLGWIADTRQADMRCFHVLSLALMAAQPWIDLTYGTVYPSLDIAYSLHRTPLSAQVDERKSNIVVSSQIAEKAPCLVRIVGDISERKTR